MDLKRPRLGKSESHVCNLNVLVVGYLVEVNHLTCLSRLHAKFEKYVRAQSCSPLISNDHLCRLQLVDKAYRRKD